MYLTQYDHDRLNEAVDHLNILMQQTNGLIEQEFLDDTRKRILTLTLYPVAGGEDDMTVYGDLDPNDRPRPQLQPARLWPYVVTGLLVALAAWAYVTPIPTHTRPEPISVGPASPLYGPLTTTKGE